MRTNSQNNEVSNSTFKQQYYIRIIPGTESVSETDTDIVFTLFV